MLLVTLAVLPSLSIHMLASAAVSDKVSSTGAASKCAVHFTSL